MGKVNDARKALLDTQLKLAVVEHIGTEANDYPSWDVGTYSVFVPGAVRERNIVKADDEDEAREKVRICLEKKIDQMSEVEAKADDVEIDPDNLKQTFKSKITLEEEK